MKSDIYGRSFRSLRISLTRKCNFACTYCVSGKDLQQKEVQPPLGANALTDLVRDIRKQTELSEVRLTGGEPLLYNELPELIKKLSAMQLPVKMTTNAFLLKGRAKALKEAGLDSVNISLDAVDADLFRVLTRRNSLGAVIEGIDEALSEGMEVKLNAVIMKGKNEGQVLPLLDFAASRKISLRFLELMEMGHLNGMATDLMVTEKEVMDQITRVHGVYPCERKPSATARYFITDTMVSFGFISNSSAPFCSDCDRLRLDSYGNIYGCLSSNFGISIKDSGEAELEEKLQLALSQKKASFTGSSLSMKYIGG